MMLRGGFLVTVLAVCHCAAAFGAESKANKTQTYDIAKAASKVEFNAVGNPGFIRISGTGGHADGKIVYGTESKKINGTLNVTLDDFTTDMTLRDRHMKEKYLEVPKFPTAQLTFKDGALDLSKGNVSADVPAELTLHGVTKTVTVNAKVTKADSAAPHLQATLKLPLTDFGISIPSFAGVTVAKDVDVTVELDAKKVTD